MDLVICACCAVLFSGAPVSLKADLGQSQPGSSNLFAWDVWRQSTIAESAALEI
jgi:hypothetical protein